MARLTLGLAAFVSSLSFAFADLRFNVVGYQTTPSNVFGVSINGQITRLATNESIFPVWTGTAPVDKTVQYSYVEINSGGSVVASEPFTRTWTRPNGDASYNEFFQRQTTVWDLPMMPYVYSGDLPSKTKAFKDDQIATIHVTAPVTEINAINANPTSEQETRVTFRFINAKTIYTQTNITMGTSGKSSKEFTKQSYKFKFDTDYNQTFFSRPNLKLRATATDPTYIREKLYIDMLNACGIPTQQGAYVRLFVNNVPYGLYLMVDDIKKSFLKQTVHGGNPNITLGSLIQFNSWLVQGDLQYKGPTSADYSPDTYISQNLGNNPPTDPLAELIVFMKDLQDFNPATDPDPVGYFNNTRLELDGFLKNMVLEYLTGAFDNYWISGSNYFMYKNAVLNNRWQFIPTDFDGTFGVGASYDLAASYKTFYDFSKNDHPLVSKLIINNTVINGHFEETLKTIVGWLFKPDGMNPRILALNKMLSDDAKWDYSLPRQYAGGKDNKFNFEQFNANLYNITPEMSGALIPWVAARANAITQELNFQLEPGNPNRVPPPTRSKDDDEDTEIEVPNAAGLSAKASSVATTLLLALTVAGLTMF